MPDRSSRPGISPYRPPSPRWAWPSSTRGSSKRNWPQANSLYRLTGAYDWIAGTGWCGAPAAREADRWPRFGAGWPKSWRKRGGNGRHPPTFLRLLIDVGSEADRSALGLRRVHELADGRENGGDGFIVGGELFIEPGLELREPASQFLVRGEQFTQLHEGAHDVDTDLDGARGVEDGGGHNRAVFGESIGKIASPTSTLGWRV